MHDPVSILRTFQKEFLTGRKLDLETDSEILEGDTSSIFVSRQRLLETGFQEILDPEFNERHPLEVTFYGEEAADVGGPRIEFLNLMLKEIIKEEMRMFKEQGGGAFIFTDDENNISKRYFYAAGLLCGMYDFLSPRNALRWGYSNAAVVPSVRPCVRGSVRPWTL